MCAAEAIGLYEKDEGTGNGDWYWVKWLGFKNRTKQHRDNFPQTTAWSKLLQLVYNKGVKAQMTPAGGRVTTRGKALGPDRGPQLHLQGGCNDRPCLGVIDFRSARDKCVPSAIANLCGFSKKRFKKLLKRLQTTLCGLSDLADATNFFNIQLSRCENATIAWVLSQEKGLYLIYQGVHCIGVDCTKRFLYDSAMPNVLPLTQQSIVHCEFTDAKPSDIRVVNNSR
jgi:hypothetical protein